MPPTLRFPLVLNNLPLDSIGCYGTWKSLFPYRKMPGWVGWDGIGWEGKGCHGMGVGLGRGTPCGKSWKNKAAFTNKSDPGIIVAPFWLLRGSLWHPWAPVCAPFYHLGGAGAFLGQSSKNIRKLSDKLSQNGAKMMPGVDLLIKCVLFLQLFQNGVPRPNPTRIP